ncbi:hypothetical protein BT69DRAFT_434304 [Atractiella rhizophila]|nr:hypothetical protein BT69DRAFT_434304 [Atractiella rhizophila]
MRSRETKYEPLHELVPEPLFNKTTPYSSREVASEPFYNETNTNSPDSPREAAPKPVCNETDTNTRISRGGTRATFQRNQDYTHLARWHPSHFATKPTPSHPPDSTRETAPEPLCNEPTPTQTSRQHSQGYETNPHLARWHPSQFARKTNTNSPTRQHSQGSTRASLQENQNQPTHPTALARQRPSHFAMNQQPTALARLQNDHSSREVAPETLCNETKHQLTHPTALARLRN